MSTAVTFDGAPERGTINFSVGQPSADLLPLSLLNAACERFFADAQPFELNYGERQGDARFREALADFLNAAPGCGATPETLMLTGGISQALDYLCSRLTEPGETVFVEDPTYPYSYPIFRDHGLSIVGVPLDEHGMDVDALEQLLARHRPKLVYTIPSFHNPTGRSLDAARRARLVELSRRHGFIIAADEVYQLLHHDMPPPASFGTMISEGNVVALGTFSKILAPGVRLGWIQASPEPLQRLLAGGAMVSGGNFNHFGSHVVRQLMENGKLAAFVAELRERYAERAAAMDAALKKHLAGRLVWRKPAGGYFFWVELPADEDAASFSAAARAAGTGFLPGAVCSAHGGLKHCLRLSFAHYSVADIQDGIARLARALAR
jgi:2-aminoadipate transaminase